MFNPTDQLIAYFSDWRRLKTAVAWVLRLKAMWLVQGRHRKQLEASKVHHHGETSQDKSKQVQRQEFMSESASGVLALDELLEAEMVIICYCQGQVR